MKDNDVIQSLAALAQETRLAIYRLLVKRGSDGFTPGEISERLAIPPSTLSFHLKELERGGLVMSRRESRFLYYSTNFDQMNALLSYLTEHCCSLSDNACDADCKTRSTKPRKRA